jgi:hypothetical protein
MGLNEVTVACVEGRGKSLSDVLRRGVIVSCVKFMKSGTAAVEKGTLKVILNTVVRISRKVHYCCLSIRRPHDEELMNSKT